MINWGVIGAGGIARRRTIPEGIIQANNAELVALWDRTEEVVRELSSKYQVEGYTKIDDILNDSRVQAVYIATPNYLHSSQAIMAAKSGKHILCEKPMALTVSDCENMIQACHEAEVKLAVGYMMRFHALHQKIREMVQDGELGKPVFGRAQLSCWYPPIPGAWRQKKELGGGGALMDMGGHCIDLLEMIMGKIQSVSCLTGNIVHDCPVEDTAVVTVQFAGGQFGTVDVSFGIPDISCKNRLEFYGSQGSILAEGTIGQESTGEAVVFLEEEDKGYHAQQTRSSVKQEGSKLKVKPINPYKAEIEDVSSSIEKDRKPRIDGLEGKRNLELILACYQSADQGGIPIEIPS